MAVAWSGIRDVGRFAGEKIWPPVSKFAKAITWTAGLVAAVSAIVLLVPAAYDQVMWRQAEYHRLDKIHAGNNSAYVDSILGVPAIVKDFDRAPGLVESIYVRRDYYVMTIVNASQRVLLYSVLSCDPEFAPTFRTPAGSQARLQSVPLSEAETFPGNASADANLNDRRITYLPPLTVSSIGQFVEIPSLAGSNAVRAQSWMVGVNSACADMSGFGSELLHDATAGGVDEAIREQRAAIAANFYAETASGVDVRVDAEANVTFGDDISPADSHSGVLVSPYHFDIPHSYDWRTATRTF